MRTIFIVLQATSVASVITSVAGSGQADAAACSKMREDKEQQRFSPLVTNWLESKYQGGDGEDMHYFVKWHRLHRRELGSSRCAHVCLKLSLQLCSHSISVKLIGLSLVELLCLWPVFMLIEAYIHTGCFALPNNIGKYFKGRIFTGIESSR